MFSPKKACPILTWWLEPKESMQATSWPWFISWLILLGSNYLWPAIWNHLVCRHVRRSFWQWYMQHTHQPQLTTLPFENKKTCVLLSTKPFLRNMVHLHTVIPKWFITVFITYLATDHTLTRCGLIVVSWTFGITTQSSFHSTWPFWNHHSKIFELSTQQPKVPQIIFSHTL